MRLPSARIGGGKVLESWAGAAACSCRSFGFAADFRQNSCRMFAQGGDSEACRAGFMAEFDRNTEMSVAGRIEQQHVARRKLWILQSLPKVFDRCKGDVASLKPFNPLSLGSLREYP